MARTLTDRHRTGASGVLALGVAAILAACDKPPAPAAPSATAPAPPASTEMLTRRGLTRERVERGAALYAGNCAVCHGARGEGAPNWHRPGPDGAYPPPPLDGSAHAWHHPRAALKRTIRDGTAKMGGRMPAWRDKLSDADIDAMIDWMIAAWPDEIYAAWRKLDAGGGRR